MELFEVPIEKLHPSQLYVNRDKLKSVNRDIQKNGILSIEPVPVKRFGSLLVLTDGHTRALAQFQIGKESITACWEDMEMDWREYEICIDWCKDEGITSIKDLQTRIITNKEYQVLWLERCRQMQQILKNKKGGL